jgi:hypothetical protein
MDPAFVKCQDCRCFDQAAGLLGNLGFCRRWSAKVSHTGASFPKVCPEDGCWEGIPKTKEFSVAQRLAGDIS